MSGDRWLDRIRVTSRLLRLLTPDDAVNIVVGNSTLIGCPYLLPVSAMTSRRLTASLLRLRPSTSHPYQLRSPIRSRILTAIFPPLHVMIIFIGATENAGVENAIRAKIWLELRT